MSKKNFDSESRRTPAFCYLFDCLYLDGRSLMNDPLDRRRWWMRDSTRVGETNYRISETVEDGDALFTAAKELGVEGIMAKRRDGKYTPGRRNDTWIKVKVKETMDCLIIGFTVGEGEREKTFGSLQLAEDKDGELIYRGRVGTGFDDSLLKKMKSQLDKLVIEDKPIPAEAHEEKKSIWVNPELVCEVEYSMITKNGTFRDPVFKKIVT
jgi:bifunctional non-homologous end joining protein LigD